MMYADEIVIAGSIYDAETGEFLRFVDRAPTFVPNDKESVEWVLRKMLEAESEVTAIDNTADVIAARALISNAERMRNDAQRRYESLERRFKADLGKYAEKQLKDKKTKTLKTLYGSVALKTKARLLVVRDEAKAIAWAVLNKPEAIKTSASFLISELDSIQKDAIIDGIGKGLAVAEAFAIEPEKETVHIKTGAASDPAQAPRKRALATQIGVRSRGNADDGPHPHDHSRMDRPRRGPSFPGRQPRKDPDPGPTRPRGRASKATNGGLLMSAWKYVKPRKLGRPRTREEAPKARLSAVPPCVTVSRSARAKLTLNRAAMEDAGLQLGDFVALMHKSDEGLYLLTKVDRSHKAAAGAIIKGSNGTGVCCGIGHMLRARKVPAGRAIVLCEPGQIMIDVADIGAPVRL